VWTKVDHVQLNHVIVVLHIMRETKLTENKQKLSIKMCPNQGSEPVCNELTNNHKKVATVV
jgi:hypothetical protein